MTSPYPYTGMQKKFLFKFSTFPLSTFTLFAHELHIITLVSDLQNLEAKNIIWQPSRQPSALRYNSAALL
jgi:hypothetical protein